MKFFFFLGFSSFARRKHSIVFYTSGYNKHMTEIKESGAYHMPSSPLSITAKSRAFICRTIKQGKKIYGGITLLLFV